MQDGRETKKEIVWLGGRGWAGSQRWQCSNVQVPMASTSADAEPPSKILQEIEALFSWNPPHLIPAPLPPGKKPSTSTCPPAFYDKTYSC